MSAKESLEPDETILLSVRRAACILSVSERTLWELIKRGEVPTVRLGRRVLIARKDLELLAAASTRRAI